MDEITVPIYLITGFLESGKTSFLSFTLQQDYFRTEGKTLLILCEEGEEEYDEEALAKDNVVVEVIEKEEDFISYEYDLENLEYNEDHKVTQKAEGTTLPLTIPMFDQDAIFFEHTNSHRVSFLNKSISSKE